MSHDWSTFHHRLRAKLRGEFEDLYLRYLAAKRDYPCMEHPEPPGFGIFAPEETAILKAQCEREFNRSA